MRIFAAFASLAVCAGALAQSLAFTYQGELKSAGQPANGVYDMQFRLYDDAQEGANSASACADNVNVVDGRFTVVIDFAQQYANTSPRFLEIAVRADSGLSCANPSGFTTLTPRQPLTAVPRAAAASAALMLAAPDGDPAQAVVVDNVGRVGIGTLVPQAPLHVNGFIQWGGAGSLFAYNGVDDNGGFIEQHGTKPVNSRLRVQSSRNGDFVNYTQLNIDPAAGFSLVSLGSGNGNVGIGTTNPVALLDVRGNAAISGSLGLGTTTPTSKLDVRGNVKLGFSSEFFAPGGVENLRIIRGTVASNGAVLEGLGFSVLNDFTGGYLITFSTPFADNPTVTATGDIAQGSVRPTAFLNTVSPSAARVFLRRADDSDFVNGRFHFIAIGPR
ncbi:MAG: hypothetical protein SFY69_00890 [Planctomycetota bacterium]|nr:hypothetical protein [Planctomycetota bacterium]